MRGQRGYPWCLSLQQSCPTCREASHFPLGNINPLQQEKAKPVQGAQAEAGEQGELCSGRA